MGGTFAPVAGSGLCPARTAKVSNCILRTRGNIRYKILYFVKEDVIIGTKFRELYHAYNRRGLITSSELGDSLHRDLQGASNVVIELCGVRIKLGLPNRETLASLQQIVLFSKCSDISLKAKAWRIIAFSVSPHPSSYDVYPFVAKLAKRRVSRWSKQVLVFDVAPKDIAREVYHAIFWDVVKAQLESKGWLCIHASMIRGPRGAIIFAGPKGSGKTTLILLAATRQGMKILSNDIVFIRLLGNRLYAIGVATPTVNMKWNSLEMLKRVGYGKFVELETQRAPEIEVNLGKVCGRRKFMITNDPVPVDMIIFPSLKRTLINTPLARLEGFKVSELLDANMWKYDPSLVAANIESDDYYNKALAITGKRLPTHLLSSLERIAFKRQFCSLSLPYNRIDETNDIVGHILSKGEQALDSHLE